jgi:hypothetical protein
MSKHSRPPNLWVAVHLMPRKRRKNSIIHGSSPTKKQLDCFFELNPITKKLKQSNLLGKPLIFLGGRLLIKTEST